MPSEEMKGGLQGRGKAGRWLEERRVPVAQEGTRGNDGVRAKIFRHCSQSTLSVHEYLWMVGEKALEGKIDAEELYKALKEGDFERFLQIAEEYVHLRAPGNTHKMLKRALNILRKVVNSSAFRRYLLDPKEQNRHAAEIARRRSVCPNCGRYVVGTPCSCGWRVPQEKGKPTPIPVHGHSVGPAHFILYIPHKAGVIVNPHHPLIRAIGEVILGRRRGKAEVLQGLEEIHEKSRDKEIEVPVVQESGEDEEENIEVEIVKPQRLSTLSVHEYLWMVGEKALEGKIDAEELYKALKEGDFERFLQIAEEHVHLKEPGKTHKALKRNLNILREVVNSSAFRRYLLDPKEQNRHAAEIARRRSVCPNCGRYVVGTPCSCGWRVPQEKGKPTPIPVFVQPGGRPPFILVVPYNRGALVNPHHPLIRAIGEVILGRRGRNA